MSVVSLKWLLLYGKITSGPLDSLMGVGEKIKGNGKKAWKERCEKFAAKYFDGDLKKLTYCMKDVYNWKEWVDMNREYKDVDFTKVIEETNNVNPVQEIAMAVNVIL